MRTLFVLLIYLAARCFGFEYTEQELQEMQEGLTHWSELAENPDSIPDGDRIATLALGLRKTADPSIYVVDGRAEVHQALRDALMKTPGHALYFQENIRAARSQMKSEPDMTTRQGPLLVKYNSAQGDAFKTLELLPSPETVRVLGEFLFDVEDLVPPSPPGSVDDRIARQRDQGYVDNSFRAFAAFSRLPLLSPPAPQKRFVSVTDYERDSNAWCLWFEQIKAGKRTFRFEGDPQEYNLQGPVGVTAAAAEGSLKSVTPMANSAAASEEASAKRWPLWVALGALAAGVVAYVGKRRAGRSGI
ncbi:hypothetical protein [Haloferula sp. BvORR071]|uniref:hypothetical protein n=1 Tax=Haloferula sp. BvORR071 TaxID=1396141 RepID=UPI00055985B5|nr:hypothetical protein [Haloferula sp. BvORR071]